MERAIMRTLRIEEAGEHECERAQILQRQGAAEMQPRIRRDSERGIEHVHRFLRSAEA